MFKLIKAIFVFPVLMVKWIFIIGIAIVLLGITFFMNAFTIPLYIILYIICRLFGFRRPSFANWYLMLYPSWKKSIFPNKNYKTGNMTGLQYEHYCASYLRKKGYHNIQVTQASGDFGADITAVDKHGRRWVFQCKLYKSKLGNDPVQEIVSAKAHYGASRAGVITNSELTDAARQLARENDVKLYEYVTPRQKWK